MTGRTMMQTKTNPTSPVTMLGTEAVRIANGPASRPYYWDKGPAIFR